MKVRSSINTRLRVYDTNRLVMAQGAVTVMVVSCGLSVLVGAFWFMAFAINQKLDMMPAILGALSIFAAGGLVLGLLGVLYENLRYGALNEADLVALPRPLQERVHSSLSQEYDENLTWGQIIKWGDELEAKRQKLQAFQLRQEQSAKLREAMRLVRVETAGTSNQAQVVKLE